MSTVSITLVSSGDARPLVEAIRSDNPEAKIQNLPSIIKIDCPNELVIKADTVSDRIGRPWDTQELHLSLVSLSGNIDQDEERVLLSWKA